MTISSLDPDRDDLGGELDVSKLEAVLRLIEGRARRFRWSANSVTGFGAILVFGTFISTCATPFQSGNGLTQWEYVTTMIIGAILMLAGPVILGRVDVESTKLAANVVEKVDLRRPRHQPD